MSRPVSIAFLLLFLLPGSLSAQRTKWTFGQCLDTAIVRNISISQSRLANELNTVTLEQSKASRIPSLNANLNEGFNFGYNIDPTTNLYENQAYTSTSLGLSSNLVLFNGLQVRNTIKRNRMNVEAGGYDIEKIKDDVTLNITTAFLQLMFAYEALDIARKQVETSTAQSSQTEKMMNAGKVPESNLLQVKAALANDRVTEITASNTLDLARVNLMQLMELQVSDSFEIVKPDLSIPPADLFRSAEEVYRKSVQIMPQVAGAEARTNSALMDIRITSGAQWPRLSLGANLSSNYAASMINSDDPMDASDPFFQQIWNNLGQSVNFSLSIPIYSNRQIKSNIDRARINLQNARLSELNIKNQLRKIIEQTFTDLKSAMKKYEATEEALKSAELSYKTSERKFDVGLLDAISFLVEKNNLYAAESNLLRAKYEFIFQKKIFDFYLGIPITF